MRNILGEEGSQGKAVIEGADQCLSIPGVTLHIYGKETSKPKRKMAHLTATAATLEEAEKNADKAKDFIKIHG